MIAPSIESVDVPIIVGSGVSGIATALRLHGSVVVTKGTIISGSSELAQGGIAAAIGTADEPAAHAADTVAVGSGLVDDFIAGLTTFDAPHQIDWLLSMGTQFDRNDSNQLDLGREAGHSAHRILHADGDATGREIMRALGSAAADRPDITFLAQTEVVDLVRDGSRIAGVIVREFGGSYRVILAPAVVLATGGLGGAFSKTTNPPSIRGDGLAVAARAGALLGDLEFVQFHPTALNGEADPLPPPHRSTTGSRSDPP